MTELITFDKERALAGDPVITRDRKKVLELNFFKSINLVYPVAAFIEGMHWPIGITEKGRDIDDDTDSDFDLFMAPKTKKLWIAVLKNDYKGYTGEKSHLTSNAFESLDEIKKLVEKPSIWNFVQIEIEE